MNRKMQILGLTIALWAIWTVVSFAHSPPYPASSVAPIPYWQVGVQGPQGLVPVAIYQTAWEAELTRSQLAALGHTVHIATGTTTWTHWRRMYREAEYGRRWLRWFPVGPIVEPRPPLPGLGIEGGGFSPGRRSVIDGAGFDPGRRGFVEPTQPAPRVDPRGNFGTRPGTGVQINRGSLGTQPSR